MSRSLAAPLLAALALLAPVRPGSAHPTWPRPGSLVGVTVEVEGATVPLFAAHDGSGRYYVEARRNAGYSVRLVNRTGERLAVLMAVDGLNVISGERQPMSGRGRMYVLDPWEAALIRGWRTSLDDIQRFVFVDEQRSYAARSGKANSRMGWIEVAVFRERHRPHVRRRPDVTTQEGGRAQGEASQPPASAAPRRGQDSADKAVGGGRRESYPGTGWGEHAHDPVSVVDFDPEPQPAERITLRYEYAPALRALGILPHPHGHTRLRERDRGEGFASPPRW